MINRLEFPIVKFTTEMSIRDDRTLLCTVQLRNHLSVKDVGNLPSELSNCDLSTNHNNELDFYADDKEQANKIVHQILVAYYNKYSRIENIMDSAKSVWDSLVKGVWGK